MRVAWPCAVTVSMLWRLATVSDRGLRPSCMDTAVLRPHKIPICWCWSWRSWRRKSVDQAVSCRPRTQAMQMCLLQAQKGVYGYLLVKRSVGRSALPSLGVCLVI